MAQKILIVDDDKMLLTMYALKFQKSGFEVDTAVGGEDALKKLKEGPAVDILLVDIVMPAMDGLEFLAKMRNDRLGAHATIIVLSNQSQQTDMDRANSLGVKHYIVKASAIPSEVVDQVIAIIGKDKK